MLECCKEWMVLLVFTISGAIHPMLLTWLADGGAIDPLSLTFVLPSYIGMTIAGVVLYHLRHDLGDDPEETEEVHDALPYKLLTLLSICDIASSFLHLTGLIFAGSSVYTLAYSSVTITTAILSSIILKRHLHALQWLGLGLICTGLALSGVFKKFPDLHAFSQSFALPTGVGNDQAGINANIAEEDSQAIGIALILAGSLVHSFCFVLTEVLLTSSTSSNASVPPHVLCIFLGSSGLIVYSIWQVIFTLPHGGSIRPNIIVYLFLTANSVVHTLCFFRFIIKLGCTTVGVLKSVQAFALFFFSHLVYCSANHPSACITTPRVESMALSLAGVLLYGFTHADRNDIRMEHSAVVEMPHSNATTGIVAEGSYLLRGSTYSFDGDLCYGSMPAPASRTSSSA